MLIRFFVQAVPSFRKQTLTMLIASSIQWVGYVIYLLGVGPENLDLNPILLSLSLPVYALGIFRFYLFKLVPLARDTVFEEMKDAVIVVDPELRLVDCNKRSRLLLPEIFNKNSIGEDVRQLLAARPRILEIFTLDRGQELEIPLEENNQPLVFNLSLSPLFDREKRQIASILTFHDHTRQKRLMDALEKMATIDVLTGINNRRHLMSLSEIEMSRSKRNKKPLSLLLLDLDHFKCINDTWDLDNPTVESLVQYADKALYTGKNQGRNRVILCHPH